MARKKQTATDRSSEAKISKKTFTLPIPIVVEPKKEREKILEKTSLYVPTKSLFSNKVDFTPASFSNEVLVTRNLPEVLKVIFKYGDVAKRYGKGGLENDPARQQIIIYTMVSCQKNLLWYQRSAPETIKGKKFTGDSRLQGRYSVGFGGHKTREDITVSREELIFLKDLMPAVQDEVGTVLGLNRGFFSEVEEEIGITRDGIRNLKFFGAFYDKRVENPLLPIQVGWVHTGLAAILEINPQSVNQLSFRTSEIAKAWWVPFKDVRKEFETRQKAWREGKGPKVETWTEIVINEFWKNHSS